MAYAATCQENEFKMKVKRKKKLQGRIKRHDDIPTTAWSSETNFATSPETMVL